jgi:hypothetical protein
VILGGELDVVAGQWKACIVRDPTHNRIKLLCTWAAKSDDLQRGPWEMAPFYVGIDTGQCLVMDSKAAPKHDPQQGDASNPHTFYGSVGVVCDTNTLVLPSQTGVACRSGYGDGIYDVLIRREVKSQLVTDVNVLFITERLLEQVGQNDEYHDANIVRDMIVGPRDFAKHA